MISTLVARFAAADDILLRESDFIAPVLGGGIVREGTISAVENLERTRVVALFGGLLGDGDSLGHFAVKVFVTRSDLVEQGGWLSWNHRGRLRSLDLGGFGIGLGLVSGGEGSLDGGDAFLGGFIVRGNLLDLLELFERDLEVTLLASGQRLGEELGLLRHRIYVLGDERADSDGGSEGGPSEPVAFMIFHRVSGGKRLFRSFIFVRGSRLDLGGDGQGLGEGFTPLLRVGDKGLLNGHGLVNQVNVFDDEIGTFIGEFIALAVAGPGRGGAIGRRQEDVNRILELDGLDIVNFDQPTGGLVV